MPSGLGPVYFTDENALGLGKLLERAGRSNVLYPGHQGCPKSHLALPTLSGCPKSPAAN